MVILAARTQDQQIAIARAGAVDPDLGLIGMRQQDDARQARMGAPGRDLRQALAAALHQDGAEIEMRQFGAVIAPRQDHYPLIRATQAGAVLTGIGEGQEVVSGHQRNIASPGGATRQRFRQNCIVRELISGNTPAPTAECRMENPHGERRHPRAGVFWLHSDNRGCAPSRCGRAGNRLSGRHDDDRRPLSAAAAAALHRPDRPERRRSRSRPGRRAWCRPRARRTSCSS